MRTTAICGLCVSSYATSQQANSRKCGKIFRDEQYTFVVEKNNIVTDLNELVVISKISAEHIPQWLPVPMPAGMYVQAETADRVKELFVSLAHSFAAPVPARAAGHAMSHFAFHRPTPEFPLHDIIASIEGPGVDCGSVEAVVLWDGRAGFLGRACEISDCSPAKSYSFMSPTCLAAEGAASVVEGRGAHRKLHNSLAAIEWLPRELFVDPDEAPAEAQPLGKVDIEAPAYLSPVLPVLVKKFPVKIHTRYVMPQSEGGYALTHVENPVNLEISDEQFPTIWDFLADAPVPAVQVPQGYRVACVNTERKSQVIEIPAGKTEDKETVVKLATISALSGLLTIAWFARQRHTGRPAV